MDHRAGGLIHFEKVVALWRIWYGLWHVDVSRSSQSVSIAAVSREKRRYGTHLWCADRPVCRTNCASAVSLEDLLSLAEDIDRIQPERTCEGVQLLDADMPFTTEDLGHALL